MLPSRQRLIASSNTKLQRAHTSVPFVTSLSEVEKDNVARMAGGQKANDRMVSTRKDTKPKLHFISLKTTSLFSLLRTDESSERSNPPLCLSSSRCQTSASPSSRTLKRKLYFRKLGPFTLVDDGNVSAYAHFASKIFESVIRSYASSSLD